MKVIHGDNIELLKDSISCYYNVTEDARVINIKSNKQLKFYIDRNGYLKARIYCKLSKHKDKRIPFKLHRLVALFHLKDFDVNLQVNHKNGIKQDNHVSNLEMVNNQQNVQHYWDNLDENHIRRKSFIRNEKGQFSKRLKNNNE
jgi:hypothetical protein